jgi:hypothetical protein
MDFYTSFESLLENGYLEKCIELFYLKDNEHYLNEFSWDLASLFVNYLNNSNNSIETEGKKSILEFVEAANLHLCKNNGNPRELFLIYLENTEFFFRQDINFLKLVDLIQILLLRVQSKCVYHSIELAVDQFLKYLKSKVSVSNEEKNEDLGTQLRINLLYGKFLDFIQTFINREFEQNQNDLALFSQKLKNFLTTVLVNLFDEPFLGIHFQNDSNYSSIISKCLQQINNMNRDLFKLVVKLEMELKKSDLSLESDEEKEENIKTLNLNGLSISSLVHYLCVFKWPGQDQNYLFKVSFYNFPNIYTHLFVFQTFLPILMRLLAFNDQSAESINLFKGLEALNLILNRIENASLCEDLLTCDYIMEFCDLLLKISVYSLDEQVRKNYGLLLKLFFKKMNRQARFAFIKDFLNKNSNSDDTFCIYVCSFLMYLFKEELNECLSNKDDQFYSSQKSNFAYMFKLIFKLDQGEKTDLVHQSTKLIACLNLFRYLLIRDKENFTGVADLFVQVSFLSELEKAVQLSKAHYELEVKTVLSSPVKEVNNNNIMNITLQGNGDNKNPNLREPNKQDRLNALQSGLQTIDLIECLRVRIYEILNENKKS